jgi:hypothetical protein
MDLASIFRQSLELWQNPPDTELPEETFVNCANRCISQRFLDLDLTPDACFSTVKSSVFTFADSTSRERSLEDIIDDISRISRIESRIAGSTSDDDWSEEFRTSYDNWNSMAERTDRDYVSIYSGDGALTMVTARDVSTLEFRIVYRQLRDKINTLSEVIDLPAIYESVLVYDIGLEMGELIDNQSDEFRKKKSDKMPYLLGRLQDAEKRIDRWRRSQNRKPVTHRRAFNDRSDGLNIRKRRFTVNF